MIKDNATMARSHNTFNSAPSSETDPYSSGDYQEASQTGFSWTDGPEATLSSPVSSPSSYEMPTYESTGSLFGEANTLGTIPEVEYNAMPNWGAVETDSQVSDLHESGVGQPERESRLRHVGDAIGLRAVGAAVKAPGVVRDIWDRQPDVVKAAGSYAANAGLEVAKAGALDAMGVISKDFGVSLEHDNETDKMKLKVRKLKLTRKVLGLVLPGAGWKSLIGTGTRAAKAGIRGAKNSAKSQAYKAGIDAAQTASARFL